MTMEVTTATIRQKREKKELISMITAYDYNSAKIVDAAGIDMILVGDSLGMVILGYKDTLSVTLADMIHHGKAVVRGTGRAMVVVDMPFMTYHISREEAMRGAGRIIQETGAAAVKLEGGKEIQKTVKRITAAGIPVMGHLGLTPQSVAQMGGYKVQGKDQKTAQKIIDDALALEEAGIFSLVLECVPWQLAKAMQERLTIPTIGIGAGRYCDGQVLVFHDVLGLQSGLRPKFVKQYIHLEETMGKAVEEYIRELKDGSFPEEKHTFTMPEDVLNSLKW
jgi:3-methyl-2-oxobutanoate hydroxymethyltransferase